VIRVFAGLAMTLLAGAYYLCALMFILGDASLGTAFGWLMAAA
jgi:hypothetical protein